MAARISALPLDTVVVPGEGTSIMLTVRNVGELVDRFTIQVAGDPAAWTEIVPPQLPLLPGAEGTVELRFTPPRAPSTTAGDHALVVRALSEKEPSSPAVREGSIRVAPFFGMSARLVPQNTSGRRKADHHLTVVNEGNDALSATASAADADGELSFTIDRASLQVPAGRAGSATVGLRARSRLLKGRPKPRPFQVVVAAGDTTIPLDGVFTQKAMLPRWLIVAFIALIGLFAFVSQQNGLNGLALILLAIFVVALLIVVVLLLLAATLMKNLFRRRRTSEAR